MTTIGIIITVIVVVWVVRSSIKEANPKSQAFQEKFGPEKRHLDPPSKRKKLALIEECNITIMKEVENSGINMSEVFVSNPDPAKFDEFMKISTKLKSKYVNDYPSLFSSTSDFDIHNL